MAKVVKFYSDSCAPCKAMNPVFDEVLNELGLIGECKNLGDDGVRELALESGVRSIPSFVVYTNSGEILSRSGIMSKKDLKSFIEDAV
jgi:thioredoxin 1